MKTTAMPLLSVAVMSAFSSAFGTEKYIKIDPTSGKPEYISKEDAKNVAGMPEEGKLCEIAFKDVLIPKVTEAETKNVPGYEFDCNPSKFYDETGNLIRSARARRRFQKSHEFCSHHIALPAKTNFLCPR